MFKSIFGRMFWTYAILLVVVLSSISLMMAGLLMQFTQRKQIENISSVAHTIEEWTGIVQIEQNDERSMRSYKNFLRSWGNFAMADITVTNRDGEVFESTCGIDAVPDELLECIDTDEIVVHKSNFNNFYKSPVLSFAYPMHYKGNTIGSIIFNKSIPEMRRMTLELLLLFVLSSFSSLLIAFVIVYFQAKKISAPIAQINKAAQNIATGNFNQRVDITSNDEIGQLASTFNFMASSIEKADSNRQRFISDVSHELRTPMTSITGFVQGMLDGTIPPEEHEDYLKIVLDESTRLTRLVNNMLEMSKLQSDKFEITIAPFDINELIRLSLISLENKIDSRNLQVDVDFNFKKLMVLADKDQIKRVLINLIDNACKFGKENTSIAIKTYVSGGKAHIKISNASDKIDDEDLKHLFNRFYKTDTSRKRDRAGAGLGLSLVQNILRLHKQTIEVTNTKNTNDEFYTTTFEFTLELK